MLELIASYLHFVSILVFFAASVVKYALIPHKIRRRGFLRIVPLNYIGLVSLAVILLSGITLLQAQNSSVNIRNPILLIKLALFVICIGISLYTVWFFKQRYHGDPKENLTIPQNIKTVIRANLIIVLIISLLSMIATYQPLISSP